MCIRDRHPDRVLGPLVRATVDNALASGENALTGPVARGDVTTVAAHVAALRELAGGGAGLAHDAAGPVGSAEHHAAGPTGNTDHDAALQLLAGYRALARQTARRAAVSGRLDETSYRAVMAAIEELSLIHI